MKKVTLAIVLFLACLIPGIGLAAPFAYVTNNADDTVSVIDLATNTVVGSPIVVGDGPFRIATSGNGTRVYVANMDGDSVS
ncbi:MAG TPA: hypothetical protein VK435_01320, partial [Thermodesulfovibrionales bacterium]|nr:hypothetical protein [Thermodesulfovibrionales bacterium]